MTMRRMFWMVVLGLFGCGTAQLSTGTGKRVSLKMGKLSNDDLLAGDWQGSYDVHSWDPSRLDASKLEVLSILVQPAPRSANAYLNYAALFADDKLSVGVQFGWDYNA